MQSMSTQTGPFTYFFCRDDQFYVMKICSSSSETNKEPGIYWHIKTTGVRNHGSTLLLQKLHDNFGPNDCHVCLSTIWEQYL